nr:hypothetical protein Iba_chr04bCG14200 [Ipomoea batatas]
MDLGEAEKVCCACPVACRAMHTFKDLSRKCSSGNALSKGTFCVKLAPPPPLKGGDVGTAPFRPDETLRESPGLGISVEGMLGAAPCPLKDIPLPRPPWGPRVISSPRDLCGRGTEKVLLSKEFSNFGLETSAASSQSSGSTLIWVPFLLDTSCTTSGVTGFEPSLVVLSILSADVAWYFFAYSALSETSPWQRNQQYYFQYFHLHLLRLSWKEIDKTEDQIPDFQSIKLFSVVSTEVPQSMESVTLCKEDSSVWLISSEALKETDSEEAPEVLLSCLRLFCNFKSLSFLLKVSGIGGSPSKLIVPKGLEEYCVLALLGFSINSIQSGTGASSVVPIGTDVELSTNAVFDEDEHNGAPSREEPTTTVDGLLAAGTDEGSDPSPVGELTEVVAWKAMMELAAQNGRFWKLKLVDEKVAHTLGVIETSLELVPGVPVRYADDHGLLAAVRVGWRARRGVVIRRRRGGGWRTRRRPMMSSRRRIDGAWIGDLSHGLANCTPDGSGARRQLQLGPAVGAIYKHKHGDLSKKHTLLRGRVDC